MISFKFSLFPLLKRRQSTLSNTSNSKSVKSRNKFLFTIFNFENGN